MMLVTLKFGVSKIMFKTFKKQRLLRHTGEFTVDLSISTTVNC
jgi:hypothetical protein